MPKILAVNFWFPEALASRWSRIPRRLGYAVDAVPAEVTRWYWEAEAAGEVNRMALGFRPKDKQIDAALIEQVIALDRSALVVTGSTIIHVIVNQDLLQIYDSTHSWWVDMRVFIKAARRFGYESHVEYRQSHSDLVMETLAAAFIVSGAEFAFQNLTENWKRGHYQKPKRLFSCPQELATQWPDKLLDSPENCHLIPLCPTAHPSTTERYVSGTIGNIFGGVKIYSGPAFDSSTWEDTAFLGIEPYGRFPRKALVNDLSKKAIAQGARLLNFSPAPHS